MTYAQIVMMATQICKVPSWTAQAAMLVTAALDDLCEAHDMEVARGTFLFNFNSATGNGTGPYLMPVDYLRPNRDEVFFTISGQKYRMTALELAEYDALVQQAGIAGYPTSYVIDNSPLAADGGQAQMFVWPPPSGAYPVTMRYQRRMPPVADPASDTTVPWFPVPKWLIKQVSADLMDITDDERKPQFQAEADKLLSDYLKMEGASTDRVKRVTLDRRRFGTGYDTLKNTKFLGW